MRGPGCLALPKWQAEDTRYSDNLALWGSMLLHEPSVTLPSTALVIGSLY